MLNRTERVFRNNTLQLQNTSNVFQIQLQILSPHSYLMVLSVTLIYCEDGNIIIINYSTYHKFVT